jgi:hypothetical protein
LSRFIKIYFTELLEKTNYLELFKSEFEKISDTNNDEKESLFITFFSSILAKSYVFGLNKLVEYSFENEKPKISDKVEQGIYKTTQEIEAIAEVDDIFDLINN